MTSRSSFFGSPDQTNTFEGPLETVRDEKYRLRDRFLVSERNVVGRHRDVRVYCCGVGLSALLILRG